MRLTSGVAWRNLSAASLTLVLLASPSMAADPIAIADEVVAAFTSGTRTASYASATATPAGDVITITGFAYTDDPNGTAGAVAEIVITNAIEVETGGFTAELVVLRDGSLTDMANVVRFEHVELTDVIIPPTEAGEGELPSIPVSGLIADGLRLEPPQANAVVIERVEMTLGAVAEGVPYAITAAVRGLEVPLNLGDNSDAIAVIRSLGFETMFLDFNVAGAFDSDNDTLTLESLGIAIREFGHLDIAGTVTGVALGRLQDPGGPNEILAAAMVNNVNVRFENGGAMEAFLREQADLTGLQPEDVAFGLAAAFQIFLRTLENPTLEQQVGQAVGAFLRDPQSITLVATPLEPVPLMEIIGLLINAPTALPALLNVIVTAND